MCQFEVKNATLGYSDKPVLKNVNFGVGTGEIYCVLGKNGAGKSTLFKSMLGLLNPISGEILLDGRPVTQWNRKLFARKVAYVPQGRSLPFPFTVLDVVLFGRTSHLAPFSSPGKKDRIIAEECLDLLNIRDLRDRIFTGLSGGEQQMVVIARALAQQPDFLVMDEPTSSLDFGNQIRIISRVNELKNNALGIIMATHSPDHAFMCDARVAVVHNSAVWSAADAGEIVTEEVLHEIYGVKVKIRLLGRKPGCSRLVCMPVM